MKKTKISLLEFESEAIAQHNSGITTITFFRGSLVDVAPIILEKFNELIRSNPWLAGKLERKNKKERLELWYSEDVSEELSSKLFHLNPQGVSVNSKMSYAELGIAADSCILPNAKKTVNRDKPLTSLTLIADSLEPESAFAMIFSLSHNIADGHTYYSILNMLSKDAPMESLNVTRKNEATPKMIGAVGEKEYKYFKGVAHFINIFRGIIFGKKIQAFAFYIDELKIDEIKSQEKKKIEYVSTNDILSSSFANLVNARVSMMAINYRGKLSGLEEKDAGNYEGIVMHDKDNYKDAASVRASLKGGSPYIGLRKPLPSFIEGIFCQMSLITNWASFSKEIIIDNCEEILHLPLGRASGMMPYEIAIIFRAKKERHGIIYFTKKLQASNFNSEVVPIKEILF
ncbi:hypothetical protein GJV85_11280 [Sulfurimonas aquatica]|uniref:Uncharacterized protein n=1 Tax=Sulfurimonas aquatica TaxID=2672570 RepID=A0A975GDJ9_9BACT|nr:hypothetical protein [Sulfurimonas aquatica]QSZ42667.1 hypothetical protein GJV85_11280 [Sulfurimonas aquatica]